MKENYLWDKTGSDPEIENLENALKAFRYKETEPPALPAKIIPFEPKSPRRFFRFGFAFAAFAALLLITFGIWFQFSVNKIQGINDLTQMPVSQIKSDIQPEISDTKSRDSVFAEENNPALTKINNSKQAAKTVAVKPRRQIRSEAKQNRTNRKKPEIKDSFDEFTEEEKFAYNQLMLALSITGSKLKMVQDRVEGVEE